MKTFFIILMIFLVIFPGLRTIGNTTRLQNHTLKDVKLLNSHIDSLRVVYFELLDEREQIKHTNPDFFRSSYITIPELKPMIPYAPFQKMPFSTIQIRKKKNSRNAGLALMGCFTFLWGLGSYIEKNPGGSYEEGEKEKARKSAKTLKNIGIYLTSPTAIVTALIQLDYSNAKRENAKSQKENLNLRKANETIKKLNDRIRERNRQFIITAINSKLDLLTKEIKASYTQLEKNISKISLNPRVSVWISPINQKARVFFPNDSIEIFPNLSAQVRPVFEIPHNTRLRMRKYQEIEQSFINWVKVELSDGRNGWVKGYYLDFADPETALRWVKTYRANLREKPSKQSKVLFTLEKGDSVEAELQRKKWVKVTYTHSESDLYSFEEGKETIAGWIFAGLLSENKVQPLSFYEEEQIADQRRREANLKSHPEWPKRFREAIREGKIMIGMTKEMVEAAWGYPSDTNEGYSIGTGSYAVWWYRYMDEYIMVDFSDGVVTGWSK